MCQISSCSLPRALSHLDERIDRTLALVAHLEYRAGQAIAKTLAPVSNTMAKVACYIRYNWVTILTYYLAWGVILGCTGLMYGFKAVSLPLSVGLTCGIGFGLISGTLTVLIVRAKTHQKIHKDQLPSLWTYLNHWINGLDENGTRRIVLSVAVTVILAAAVVFPYVIGGLLGMIIGNHLATKIGLNVNLKGEQEHVSTQEELLSELDALRAKVLDGSHGEHELPKKSEASQPLTFDQLFAEIERQRSVLDALEWDARNRKHYEQTKNSPAKRQLFK